MYRVLVTVKKGDREEVQLGEGQADLKAAVEIAKTADPKAHYVYVVDSDDFIVWDRNLGFLPGDDDWDDDED